MADEGGIFSASHATGDRRASELLPLVYDELRRLAGRKLAQEKPGQTLEATALVHEAYMRLVGENPRKPWHSRGHFFAAAAEAMRRILVENVRRKRRLRRGGGRKREALDEAALAQESADNSLLMVHELLDQLADEDGISAEVVKLRYFAGLTNKETAEALSMSIRTANRHWAFARAWLHRRMRDGAERAR